MQLLKPNFHAKTKTSGRYKVQVVEAATGRIVEDRPFANNLILNSGLDGVCSNASGDYRFQTAFRACHVGTGTTPVMRQSDPVTVTVSGNTATASAPFFEAGDVNRLLKLDVGTAGAERTITGFTSTTEVTLGGDTLAAGPLVATIWYVNQTGLTSPVKNTQTAVVGSCGSSFPGGATRLAWMTHDFTVEASPQNYTELAWSDHPTSPTARWSRVLIAGGSVTVLAGQLLRVRYELTVTFSPTVVQEIDWPVTGWSNNDGKFVLWAHSVPSPGIDGNGGAFGAPFAEPGYGHLCRFFNVAGTFPSAWPTFEFKGLGVAIGSQGFGTPAIQQDFATTMESYTAGTFYRDQTLSLTVAQGNRSDWQAVGLGGHSFGTIGDCFVFRWNTVREKLASHTLALVFRKSVARVLDNPAV